MFQQFKLPDTPPPLDQVVKVTKKQTDKAHKALTKLSEGLESLPVILSQEGQVICYAGLPGTESAERLAKLTARVWREGANRVARELVRFEEEIIDEADERNNVMLYSIHVAGGITLTAGWNVSISLTQIRAEVGDVRLQLLGILGIEGG